MRTNLRGLATVSFFAEDHAAAVAWYTQYLGIGPYFEKPGYAEFRLGDWEAELGIIDARYVPGADSRQGRAGALIYWHVDSVEAAVASALAQGALVFEAQQDRGHGFITASVVDPFGNLLGFMHNPHYLERLEQGVPQKN